MTRILVDLLFFTGTRGGMESYVRQIYGTLQQDPPPGVEFVALASKELAAMGAPWFPGRVIDSRVPSSSPAVWALAEQTVGAVALAERADVIHSPANFCPIITPVPVVVTIHDLLSFRHPEYVPGPSGVVQRTLLRLGGRRSAGILTDSDASARDIEGFLAVSPDRVRVVRIAGSGRRPGVAEREPDLLFSPGNRLPHKNFANLLEALALIEPARRPRLVITGGSDPDPLADDVARLGLSDDVDLRGWVAREEVDALYDSATVTVFPTRFEGFGLPVLEAMSSGCPVICSDIGVLREIGADAAVYADTTDPAALADAIEALLADPAEQARLAADGLQQAALFTWEDAAARTLASLLEVARR